MRECASLPSSGLATVRAAFVTYLACVLVITLGTRAFDARVPLLLPVAVHGGLLALAWWLPIDRAAGRIAWSAVVVLALPLAFSAVGFALPALHPQPFEWRCIAFDRWLFGVDPGVALQAFLRPWLVEGLQLAYATFYFLPVVVLVALMRSGRWPVYDEALATVSVGFLLSYLGYYLFPTLPPYRYLDFGGGLVGLGLAEEVHTWLDRLEANRFDCMPSGHTMMTLVTLELARRHAPRLLVVLLPIAGALVLATVVLRYHYVVDVVAGIVLVPVTFRAARWSCGAPA
ncbi:MAG: phosphatase PAP2 family protein [Planctomycetota bacterium]